MARSEKRDLQDEIKRLKLERQQEVARKKIEQRKIELGVLTKGRRGWSEKTKLKELELP